MLITVGVIGLLAAIAIPCVLKARATGQQKACINNLRQIDGAIQQWALEMRKSQSANVEETDVTPYLKQGSNTACPAGGQNFSDSYTLTTVNDGPVCSKVSIRHFLVIQ